MIKRLRTATLPRLPDLSALMSPARLQELAQNRRATVLTVLAFVLALVLSILSAMGASRAVEYLIAREAQNVLTEGQFDWAEIQTDGLLLTLAGEAPTEAVRFRALSALGGVIAAERIIDMVQVTPSVPIAPPRFSMEVLRNDLDVSMIGLVPAALGVDYLIERISAVDPEMSVVSMLQKADQPVPFGWERSVEFALAALTLIPNSKVSVSPDQVEITGLADSRATADAWRAQLRRVRPAGLIDRIDIRAPRDVIAPFTFRFVRDSEGAQLQACSADSDEARSAILRAVRAAGASGALQCEIGLGSPSPRWMNAVVAAVDAIGALGQGNVTFSNLDVSVIVPNTVEPDAFERAIGALQRRLPDVFSLSFERLPPAESNFAAAENAPIFTATRGAEGVVLLSGRLTDERLRDAVRVLAQSHFGLPDVQMIARVDPDMPEGWATRSLLAIDVLSRLEHGSVRVRPDQFSVQGVTGDQGASDILSRLIVEKLGRGAVFDLDVQYDERFDPVASAPTPARCERWIKERLEQNKITFDAGSARIAGTAARVLDDVAQIMRDCGGLEMEVAGHTDSQGSLEGNLRLSQQRAEAVIAALMSRGVLVSGLVAKGYGPEFPIADNATAEGRELNRRIEFRLTGAMAEAARAERGEVLPADAEPEPVALPDESELQIRVTEGAGNTTRPTARPNRN